MKAEINLFLTSQQYYDLRNAKFCLPDWFVKTRLSFSDTRRPFVHKYDHEYTNIYYFVSTVQRSCVVDMDPDLLGSGRKI